MKKILLTNHFVREFTGSEIALLDLAATFLDLKYDVTVGSFILAEPMKQQFTERDIRIIDLNTAASEYFDLIWAHHFTTLDTCLIDKNFRAKHVVFSSLSPYEPLESLPMSLDKVHMVLANSEETKNTLMGMGLPEQVLRVFPNPVVDAFFNIARPFRKTLHKLAIVSNHIPDDVMDAIQLLKRHAVDIEIFGQGYHFKLLQPEDLADFDAIVTIGRTVQYGLAMGKPVYCYDRFAGPGWITEENILEASRYNFSGRCSGHKKSAHQIADEILSGYPFMDGQTPFYKSFAEKRYRLSRLIHHLLEQLHDDTPTINCSPFTYKNIMSRQREFVRQMQMRPQMHLGLSLSYGDTPMPGVTCDQAEAYPSREFSALFEYFQQHQDAPAQYWVGIDTLTVSTREQHIAKIDNFKMLCHITRKAGNFEFSQMFNAFFSQIMKIPEHEQCIIYGHGTVGQVIYALNKTPMLAFVDQKSARLSETVTKGEVYAPANLHNMHYDKIIISVLGREREIETYLTNELGVSADAIITFSL